MAANIAEAEQRYSPEGAGKAIVTELNKGVDKLDDGRGGSIFFGTLENGSGTVALKSNEVFLHVEDSKVVGGHCRDKEDEEMGKFLEELLEVVKKEQGTE